MSQAHVIDYRRRPRGRGAISLRPQYGYELSCTCGWQKKVNGTKREAAWFERDHQRSVMAAKKAAATKKPAQKKAVAKRPARRTGTGLGEAGGSKATVTRMDDGIDVVGALRHPAPEHLAKLPGFKGLEPGPGESTFTLRFVSVAAAREAFAFIWCDDGIDMESFLPWRDTEWSDVTEMGKLARRLVRG